MASCPPPASARPIKPIYTALDRAGIHDNSARRPANAKLRLTDMDRDGVQTQLIFGPIFQISTDDRCCARPVIGYSTTGCWTFVGGDRTG